LLVLVAAPFLYLLPYVLPFGISGFDISVGNDFRILYYNYKVYLLHFLSRLELPYWSPSEASGYPFFSNPFTQFYYPLNIPLALYYKLTGGYTSADHVRFTVLAFSIFSAGIFKWLRTFNLGLVPAFLSAFIVTASIGSLETLRFPNAIHTLCWIPWILFSVNRIFLAENKSGYIKYSFLLLVCIVCSVTAGYPYYLYYSLFIFAPYFIFFFFGYTRSNILKLEIKKTLSPAAAIIITSVIATVVCYPYLHSVSDLMNQTNGRSGGNYEYSTSSSETPLSTLGSLLYPPLSSIQTGFYLGLMSLFVLLVYFVKTNKTAGESKETRKWFLLIWIVLLVYITYGSGSLLFNLLWKYMPFFSSLREWGRMNKILLVLFSWLLAVAYSDLFKRIRNNNLYSGKTSIVLISVSALITVFTVICVVFNLTSTQWSEFFVNSKVEMLTQFSPAYSGMVKYVMSAYGYVFLLFSLFLMITLLVYYNSKRLQHLSGKKNLVFAFILVFSFAESYSFAPWLWIKAEKNKKRETLSIDYKEAFQTARTLTYKTVSLNNSYNTGLVEDWYYQSYVDFLRGNSTDTVSLYKFLGISTPMKLYLTSSIKHKDIKSFLSDADSSSAEISLVNYDGNSLEVNVKANVDGYLNFIDNWDEKWNATVNSNPVIVEKLFGTFKSVRIEKGINNVKFVYKPYSTSFGTVISCTVRILNE